MVKLALELSADLGSEAITGGFAPSRTQHHSKAPAVAGALTALHKGCFPPVQWPQILGDLSPMP